MRLLCIVQGLVIYGDAQRTSLHLDDAARTTPEDRNDMLTIDELTALRDGVAAALALRTGAAAPHGTLSRYADMLGEFAKYPDAGKGTALSLAYSSLGFAGESGEVAEKMGEGGETLLQSAARISERIKKRLRDGVIDRVATAKELGDSLWYWLRLCVELGLNPDDVARANYEKLASRRARGMIGGSGDNR